MKPSRVGGPTPKTHLFRGRYMTAKEIAAITGKDVNLIHQRIRQGRPLDVDRKPGVPPRLYVFGDERLSINEIAERTGMSRDQITRRISGDRIVSDHELATMPRERAKHECLIFYNGECMNISEWSRKLGKNKNTLIRRLHVGWPVHLALTTPSDRYRLRACNRRIIRRIAFTFTPGINLNEVLTAADFMVNEPLTGGYPTTSPLPKGTGGPRHARHADQCSGPCKQISGLPSPAETRA